MTQTLNAPDSQGDTTSETTSATTTGARPATAAEVVIDWAAVPPDEEADARDFERYIAERDSGVLVDDDFRRIRLTNGIYGIRGEDRLQMVRVKIPQGVLAPEQLRVLAKVGEEHSRGFGHITTRQNFQFHLVPIEEATAVMRMLASVGLTTREACGDTVRNVAADHMSGIGPDQIFDVTPWGRAVTDHFLRNPAGQRLPRKFKIALTGSEADLGQAAINDIGPIATRHPETGELGFKVLVGGGLGTTPHEAKVLEPFTSMADLIPTCEAILRVFDRAGERGNRNRARLKWLIQKIGIEEFRELVFAERHAVISVSGTNPGIPEVVRAAAADKEITASALAVLPPTNGNERLARWAKTNVVATQDGQFAVYVTTPLGDVTTAQFFGLADISEDFGPYGDAPADLRITNRQNVIFRGVAADRVLELWERLDAIGLGEPDAHSAGDPVSCPGADTCNIAITQSRGLAKAISERLRTDGVAASDVTINISGCSNSCGQHHLADIGFFGMERRINDRSVPDYQVLVGGGLRTDGASFGNRVGRLPAKRVPEATSVLISTWQSDAAEGESFRAWSDRLGRKEVSTLLAPFDEIGDYDGDRDAYVDFDETSDFEVALGQAECA